jgi:hypothetical protein
MGFKPKVTGPDVVAQYTHNVMRVIAHLAEIERRTGRTITLAIEPEPHCFVETTDEAVAYFHDHLYSGAAAERFGRLAGVPISEANGLLRTHLGVVYDVGHQAVEYEEPAVALAKLVAAAIPVFKLQLAAGLRVPEVGAEDLDRLCAFARSIYLTQTVERRDGRLIRHLNMEDAFRAYAVDPAPREWRIHFHVPVFLERLGALETTRAATAEALAVHRRAPLSRHVEIETYTWDVLPDEYKTGDIVDYVARELEWARSELVPAPAAV